MSSEFEKVSQREKVLAGVGLAIAMSALLTLLLLYVPPVRSAEKDILSVMFAVTNELMHAPTTEEPMFVRMSDKEMKEDMCTHPEDAAKCPSLVSIHPPGTNKILVNTGVDLNDLNAQGQIVHVMAMYILEKGGKYAPSMPCATVLKIEAFANVVQAGFMDLMLQQYAKDGVNPPEFVKHKVVTFCAPDEVKGEF